ncbi:ParA family protein [Mycolicibacterium conceptionense]|uniref:ParA family protein n=1 Tax=Mycolicibacterium conceptionense TaxID=451644 RepID=UPI0032048A55
MTTAIAGRPPTVLVATGKGGVGKTSIVANTSVAIAKKVAEKGKRVLVLDCDQQATLTMFDLGVPQEYWDKGQSLAAAMQYGSELMPVTQVRPGLDVVCGGPSLSLVSASADAAAQNGIDLAANLARAIERLCRRTPYYMIIIDSGPGDSVHILQPLLQVSSHLVVPTKEDKGSRDGVRTLAARYLRARRNGSPIELLGVVLFDANPRATKRNKVIYQHITEMLEGSGADSFESVIPSDKATAIDQREWGLTAQELIDVSNSEPSTLLSTIRNGVTPEKRTLWSNNVAPLATAYSQLSREILQRVSQSVTSAR